MTTTFRSKAAKAKDAAKVFASLFADAPCPFLVLAPDFEIIDGNRAYLDATRRGRDSLVGRQMFDAFPDNPDDPLADGVSNLHRSFESALTSGARHLMALQRYDVRDYAGRWRLRYWKPANWPVIADGRVLALVHHVVDVTEAAQTQLMSPRERHLGLLDRADLAVLTARRLSAAAHERLRLARQAASGAAARARLPD
jgi:PAS domain-containing protein